MNPQLRDPRSHLRLRDVGAPMLVVDRAEHLDELTPAADAMVQALDLRFELGRKLPLQLSATLASAPLGEAVLWRPRGETGPLLGLTRYRLGEARYLILLREITERQRAIAQQMHQQRLQEIGKLVAHIAHDLRAPLSSIVYNADLLVNRDLGASNELVAEVHLAAETLRKAIAGLLDFVRLGPPVHTETPLRDICDRVSSLLRPIFRAGGHQLTISLHDESVRISGNPLGIEQIFVNLLVNAIEASTGAAHIEIASEPVPATQPRTWRAREAVLVRVSDDGPGVPADLRAAVFEAFMTSKESGTGLGLTLTREALLALGGAIWLEDSAPGTSFAMVLPVARGEEAPV